MVEVATVTTTLGCDARGVGLGESAVGGIQPHGGAGSAETEHQRTSRRRVTLVATARNSRASSFSLSTPSIRASNAAKSPA
ncbi:hypothetical protein D3C86_1093110 [compost metagenome]